MCEVKAKGADAKCVCIRKGKTEENIDLFFAHELPETN